MKTLISLTFCCLLATGVYAQRGGGGRGGFGGGGGRGGFGGGGGRGGFVGGGGRGGFIGGGHGGFIGGGGHGGFIGGGRGGFIGGGRGGFIGGGRGVGFRSWGFNSGWGVGVWPYGWGIGAGYWPGYYWPGYYDYGYGYGYPYPAYDYTPSSNVTVVYPAQAAPPPSTVYVERARPVTQVYDEFGQERGAQDRPAGPPLYLIAFRDHVIRAATAYWVEGKSLVYVTMEHEQKTVPLDTVDKAFSQQLNRERRVAFQLP
jgi:hypothetical protein